MFYIFFRRKRKKTGKRMIRTFSLTNPNLSISLVKQGNGKSVFRSIYSKIVNFSTGCQGMMSPPPAADDVFQLREPPTLSSSRRRTPVCSEMMRGLPSCVRRHTSLPQAAFFSFFNQYLCGFSAIFPRSFGRF